MQLTITADLRPQVRNPHTSLSARALGSLGTRLVTRTERHCADSQP